MSEPNNPLEIFLSEKLKELGIEARPTKGSGGGNSTEIGDIYNNYFYIEAKQKLTKSNVIMDYKKEWLKLINDMPIDSQKIPLVVIENKLKEVFIVVKAEDFFNILSKGEYDDY